MNHDNRRAFLKNTMAALAGAALEAVPPIEHALAIEQTDAVAAGKSIDTHTHFYDPTRPQGVPWPSKNSKLYRTVLPRHLKALKKPRPLTGTVVVEASPWLEDNQWILDLAAHDTFIVGLVGRLTPSADGFRKNLKRFARNRLFRGIRVGHSQLIKGLAQQRFVDDLKLLADNDLELDVNGGPKMPSDVARLGRRIPVLRIVINHLANVRIDGKKVDESWLAGMQAAAAESNVYCKVSALVEGAAPRGRTAPTDVEFYKPTLDAVWNAFGEDRLIYGSNWPVCERAADYATLMRIVSEYFQAKGRSATGKFFWKNALAAYKWVDRSAESANRRK